MGCGMSIDQEENDSKAIQSIPIRSDILANIGVGALIPVKNKHDEDVDNLMGPILYCHICRQTGIYYTTQLFIDNQLGLNSKIKYICSFHLKKRKVLNSLL